MSEYEFNEIGQAYEELSDKMSLLGCLISFNAKYSQADSKSNSSDSSSPLIPAVKALQAVSPESISNDADRQVVKKSLSSNYIIATVAIAAIAIAGALFFNLR